MKPITEAELEESLKNKEIIEVIAKKLKCQMSQVPEMFEKFLRKQKEIREELEWKTEKLNTTKRF